MDLADFFQPSYAVSRERLLERAHALAPRHGLVVDSRALDVRGPDGETLALDFAIFGARRPKHALVLSCGTHGVEGYVGSAVQHAVLERVLPGLRLGADTAIVIQHANNPYGFAWHRRVNESNVDFNRNFRETFDPTLCDPDYERLHDELNPSDLDEAAEARRWETIRAYIAEHGLRRFQQAAVGGQYKYPRGMQYGGARPEQGTRHLLALVREHLADARTVLWLDFHTGLGEFGDCELVTGAAPDSDCYRFSTEVWPGWIKSATGGESVSTPLNGLLDRGLEAALPAGCRFAFGFPEYGTYEPVRMISAMRSDNWLHAHGDPDDARGRAIGAEVREVFSPASADWRRRTVETGLGLVAQGLDALPGARRAGR
ncbi:MAG TPA: DUF2817 domain-containing protein [Burkholderiaceae bacterium]|nr:DUF2817 domain-containing protein [Burkholderiaceae bacterium]